MILSLCFLRDTPPARDGDMGRASWAGPKHGAVGLARVQHGPYCLWVGPAWPECLSRAWVCTSAQRVGTARHDWRRASVQRTGGEEEEAGHSRRRRSSVRSHGGEEEEANLGTARQRLGAAWRRGGGRPRGGEAVRCAEERRRLARARRRRRLAERSGREAGHGEAGNRDSGLGLGPWL